MQAYLDNAATTAMDPEVVDHMADAMRTIYGNPSAIHSLGRSARAKIELSRKSIAKWLNCEAKEILFTGSGTEADNMALRCAVNDLKVKHIICSPIEHKAVLDTAKDIQQKGFAELHIVNVLKDGTVDLDHLEELAAKYPGSLVSIMHAQNELGTLNDLPAISKLVRRHSCYFHSDTVQSMAHYAFDLYELDIDFITCSAHKFHGPKGIGFLYKNKKLNLSPIITGGGQESNLRAGTENLVGIVGMAKAIDLAFTNLKHDQEYIQGLKDHARAKLEEFIPDLWVNGALEQDKALYTVLNISLPASEINSTILFQLDMMGIYVSGGSACNSGAIKSSHVLVGIGHPDERAAIRVSFSKFSTIEEIDYFAEKMRELYTVTV